MHLGDTPNRLGDGCRKYLTLSVVNEHIIYKLLGNTVNVFEKF